MVFLKIFSVVWRRSNSSAPDSWVNWERFNIVVANLSINKDGIPRHIFSRDVREAQTFEYDFHYCPHAKEPPSKAPQLGMIVNRNRKPENLCLDRGRVVQKLFCISSLESTDFALLLEGSNKICKIPLWTKPCIESRVQLQCPLKDFGALKVRSIPRWIKQNELIFLLSNKKHILYFPFHPIKHLLSLKDPHQKFEGQYYLIPSEA